MATDFDGVISGPEISLAQLSLVQHLTPAFLLKWGTGQADAAKASTHNRKHSNKIHSDFSIPVFTAHIT